nr:hypothetical protein [Streptomyces griseorubiginosus]
MSMQDAQRRTSIPRRVLSGLHQPLPPGTAPVRSTTRATPRAAVVRDRAGRRLYAIDGIRLLAALMVAVHHYAGTNRVDQPGNRVWDRPVSDIMPTVFRFASTAGSASRSSS